MACPAYFGNGFYSGRRSAVVAVGCCMPGRTRHSFAEGQRRVHFSKIFDRSVGILYAFISTASLWQCAHVAGMFVG